MDGWLAMRTATGSPSSGLIIPAEPFASPGSWFVPAALDAAEGVRHCPWTPQTPSMEPSAVDASPDGIRLADLAEELPIGRSSLFELLKSLKIVSIKGPGADGKGRVAWVSSTDADRLRAAAHAVSKGEKRLADFVAQHTVSIASPRTPQTLKKTSAPLSTDSTDASPFLARLEAAEKAIASGLGLTTAETAWILGVTPGGSPIKRGGILATRTGKNCWVLSRSS